MQITLLHPAGHLRQLAPFILLSLLLHVTLLFVIRPPTKKISVSQPHPMTVYFSASPISEQARTPIKVPIEKHSNPAKLLASLKTQIVPLPAQPDETVPSGTTEVLNLQQLMESTKSIARDEARKTEQQIVALEKKKLNTPIGSLEQDLRQPYKEIRLANGMLKIITRMGEVCFQPVPVFARDQPGLYGIPITCP